MMLKLDLRLQMTNLKRCKAEEPPSPSQMPQPTATAEPPQKRIKMDEDEADTAEQQAPSRTTRGRLITAPARFKNSVVKERSASKTSSSDDDLSRPAGENGVTSAPKTVKLKVPLTYTRRNKKSDSSSSSSSLNVKQEPVMVAEPEPETKHERRHDVHYPEDFTVGDIIWAKASKKSAAWPAVVIDPRASAPDVVLNSCLPGAICIMYFGYSGNGKNRDYGWVKEGSIFPFLENVVRFSQKAGKMKRSFAEAVEEAFEVQKIGFCRTESNCTDGPTCSDNQTVFDKQNLCTACDKNPVPKSKKSKKGEQSENKQICKKCEKLFASKQYCGVCKKIWLPTDSEDYVQCDGCDIWCHSECVRNYTVEELQSIRYFCPDCKAKSKGKLNIVIKSSIDASGSGNKLDQLPDKIPVFCQDFEGLYLPKEHMISCSCNSCKGKKISPAQFERHTGSRKKNWKLCVRLKDTLELLVNLLGEDIPKPVSCTQVGITRKDMLVELLEETYEPVKPRWLTERCAVCRWIVDWDYNRIIICNRCQVAVHQECYGAKHVMNFKSWLCGACENPQLRKDCCLCPVKGGALKPTDVSGLWVHVTCAWFNPKVRFANDVTMEPATGILNIPLQSFKKVCVICEQVHGACINCDKCDVNFHATCASRAGYHMEIFDGVTTRLIGYCPNHGETDLNSGIFVRTPDGIVSTFASESNNDEKPAGARLIRKEKDNESEKTNLPLEETSDFAARCRVYVKTKSTKSSDAAIAHRTMGPRHHSLQQIDCLNQHEGDGIIFSTFSERLQHLKRSENNRVCFGKSGIHGWGLFARRTIQQGEMVIEYRGEKVRRSVCELREKIYTSQGNKLCYLFKINEEAVIDATNRGNVARLFNHSCDPNCYARIMTMGEEEHHIVLIAKSTVPAGHELTFNYLFNPEEAEDKGTLCRCGVPTCGGYL